MSIKLDFGRLKRIKYGHAFLVLEQNDKERLAQYPELLDRIENSLHFASQIAGKYEKPLRGGFLRAALTELVSLEDVQKDVLKRPGSSPISPHKLTCSGHPMLCVVRELRNLEIHISSSSINREKRNLFWGNVDEPENADAVCWSICWIDNLSPTKFQDLNNFKQYDETEIEKALCWFEEEQRHWGIVEIVFRAITEYARELADFLATSNN